MAEQADINYTAIRAWRAYMRAHTQEWKDLMEFQDCDYKFDYGEFYNPPTPEFGVVEDHFAPAFVRVAARFGLAGAELEQMILAADWHEQYRWLCPKVSYT
jgi:hypothetical protein